MGKRLEPPYKADIVGSFLRPAELKLAREQFAKQEITAADLKQVEDKYITELVVKEKANGLIAVTDGEFRRRYWHLDFLAELLGVQEIKAEHWSVAFKGVQPKAATLKIKSKIDFPLTHSFVEAFKFLKSVAGENICKLTIPSPSMLVVSKDLSADYVYLLTKTLLENNPKLLEIHKSLKYTTDKNILNFNIPLHPGTIRYLKEKGIEVPAKLIPPEYKA